MKNLTALQKAVKLVGGQKPLARLLGTTQGHVWYWVHGLRNIPPKYVIPIEKAVKGLVTRYQLRPDLYPQD